MAPEKRVFSTLSAYLFLCGKNFVICRVRHQAVVSLITT
jgi:hypothetical protein